MKPQKPAEKGGGGAADNRISSAATQPTNAFNGTRFLVLQGGFMVKATLDRIYGTDGRSAPVQSSPSSPSVPARARRHAPARPAGRRPDILSDE